ncbi:hypothetical protein [Bdellovibrio sp. HCB-162]|uniref:hypothetical protein n=1 Tax=Bdellovibrio sp. HCB-162 TaxID=3394234 RepID=UPI0039BD7827
MLSFIFALFLSPSALATPNCPEVSGVVKEVIFLKEDDCKLAADLASTFNTMAKTFGVAPEVTLVVGGPMDNASFDNGHIIEVPYRMAFFGRYGQEYPVSLLSLITSAAHEYGHAIFHEYLKKSLPREFGSLLKEMEDISIRKERILKGATDETFSDDMKKLLTSPEYQRFTSLSPYSEFYADVLAVFNANDKSAMLSALYYSEMDTFQYNYIRMRDFEGDPDPRWENLMYEEHSKLAYTRAYVGKELWPENAEQAGHIADAIVRAILQVAKINLDQGATPDVENANAQLITELKRIH